MASATRQITLRRPDRCAACSSGLAVGERAIWDPGAREARCLACEPSWASNASVAGASAQREYQRRRDARKARARDRYGALGAVAATISSGPQHERAWDRGAEGERKLARTLEQRAADHGVVLLHDRRIPGSRANIDHIVIGRPGVFVIDAKRYSGRISVERRGGLLSPRTSHLIVGGRDKTKLVDGVLAQAEVVRAVLVAAGHEAVPMLPILCFVDGDWPFMPRLEVQGVLIVWPRQTAKLCRGDGPLDLASVESVAEAIARRLPAA
jgi:Nuclease-related domain